MSDTTQAFFERLAKRSYEPRLHSVSGNIRSNSAGAGIWYVAVNKGAITVSREMAGADSEIAYSKEDFERMVLGKQNPTTLFMQAKMKVTGNLTLVQMLQRLFPDESLAGSEQGNTERK